MFISLICAVTEKAPNPNAPAAAVAGGSAGSVVIAPSVAHNFKGFFPDQPTLARLPTVARGVCVCVCVCVCMRICMYVIFGLSSLYVCQCARLGT